MEHPSGGDIAFDGKSVLELSPRQRDVAFVFQNYALYPHKTVYENIAFPLSIGRVDKSEVKMRVQDVAVLLDIDNLLNRKPKELSGGQRQRVALGRAIIRKPRAFLLDEPLSNLDARLRVQTRVELKKLHQQLKTTFIYVTHDQTEAMSLADTIAVLSKGELLQTGSPHEIYNHPADTFIGAFTGSPGMNFIAGTVGDGGDSVIINNTEFHLPARLRVTGKVNIGLRTEHIILRKLDMPQTIKAEVYVIEPLGSEVLVEAIIGKQSIVMRTDTDFNNSIGDKIYISFNMQKANFFDPSTGKNILYQ